MSSVKSQCEGHDARMIMDVHNIRFLKHGTELLEISWNLNSIGKEQKKKKKITNSGIFRSTSYLTHSLGKWSGSRCVTITIGIL